VSLVSLKTAQPTPIWRSPLAAAANPVPQPLLMFQVRIEKVPLPPSRGGTNETDIGIDSLLKLINQKTNGRINSADSRAFTKRTSRPLQPPTSTSGQGRKHCLSVPLVIEIQLVILAPMVGGCSVRNYRMGQTATWVAGDEEGDGNDGRSNGNGDDANDDKDNESVVTKFEITVLGVPKSQKNNTPKCQITCHTLPKRSVGIS